MVGSIVLKQSTINSVGLAVLLCANPLSWVYPTNNVIVFISLLSLCILLANNRLITFVNNRLLVGFGVMLLFLFSYAFGDIDYDKYLLYFFSFLAFGMTGLLYTSIKFDYAVFYKAVFVISLLAVPGLLTLINRNYTSMATATGVWMGVSQGALRLILGLCLVLTVFKNVALKIMAVLGIIFYLSFYLGYGTRGAVLALLVFALLIFLERFKLLKTSVFLIIVLLSLLLSFYLVDIVLLIQGMLANIGVNIKALDKIIVLSRSNIDLSNGRLLLWGEAFSDIFKNPVLGYGVSAYDKRYGIYPHNYFIQILYEGGIIYFLPMLLVFVKFYKVLVGKDYSREEKRFVIFLFAGGLVELLFSNTYWRNMFFWFFIGYIISLKPKRTNDLSKLNKLQPESKLASVEVEAE